MQYIVNAAGERIAVVDVNEETGEETINREATDALNAPEAKRERAYVAEADPFRETSEHYRTEAAYWRKRGDESKAAEADAKADAALVLYGDKKAEIRERYPDSAEAAD